MGLLRPHAAKPRKHAAKLLQEILPQNTTIILHMLPLWSLAFPLVYVAPFYLDKSRLPRDHPITIRSRAIKSLVTCILFCWVPTYWTLVSYTVSTFPTSYYELPSITVATQPNTTSSRLLECRPFKSKPHLTYYHCLE